MQEQVADEISLREFITVMLVRKKLIVLIMVLVMLLSYAINLYQESYRSEVKLFYTLKFSGIESGTYPDGTEFDQYEIAKPQLVTNVLQTLNLSNQIAANTLRDHIVIEPVVTDAYSKMQAYALENEGTTLEYYPDTFSLSIKIDPFVNITRERALMLADQLIESYSGYIIEEYGKSSFYISDSYATDLSTYDYSDVSMVLHDQLDSLIQYNSLHVAMAPDYRSKKTGLSFRDLLESVQILDDIDLNRIDSTISLFRLTKDESRLKVFYEFLIKQLTYKRALLSSEAQSSKTMLASIENTNNEALSILTGEPTEAQKESYFNHLIIKTADIGTDAASLTEDIRYYQNELDQLLAGASTPLPGKKAAESDVIVAIERTTDALKLWQKATEDTSKEYYSQYLSNMVKPLSPASFNVMGRLSLNLIIGAVLGLVLGVFVAFFIDYWGRGDHEAE